MRRKLYNQRERHIYLSDNEGLHLFKDEPNKVDGIYMVTTEGDELITAINDSPNQNGTNYVMVYGTGTPTENGAELLAAYEAAKTMPRYVGDVFVGPNFTLYKGQTFRVVNDGNKYMVALQDYTGNIFNFPQKQEITEAQAKSVRTTVVVAPGAYTFSANAFNLNATNIDIKSLTGEIDVLLSSLDISVNDTFVSGMEVSSSGFININPNLSPRMSKCKGYFNGESDPLNGDFYRCNFTSIGFSEIVGKLVECTGIFSTDTFGGIAINCTLTAGSFGTPVGSAKIYNCINGNGALINYPLPAPAGGMIANPNKIIVDLTVSTDSELVDEIATLTNGIDGSYTIDVDVHPLGTGSFLNCSLLMFGGGRSGYLVSDNGSIYLLNFTNSSVVNIHMNA